MDQGGEAPFVHTGPGVRVLLVFGHALANLIAVTFRHSRYAALGTTSVEEFKHLLQTWEPHLALIDIDHFDAFVELVPQSSRRVTPILAFTRRRNTATKIRAFERGIDDVIEVPFTLDEIIARPYALLRRVHGITTSLSPQINLGGRLAVDLIGQTVKLDDQRLELTPIEQTLLYILAANAGDVLSREALLTNIWGADFEIESNVVDRHIRSLRVKLSDDWRMPRYIETISGQGYRFRAAGHSVPTAPSPAPAPTDGGAEGRPS